MEFVRALELLLDTYDRPPAPAVAPPATHDTVTPSGITLHDTSRTNAPHLAALDDKRFQLLLKKLSRSRDAKLPKIAESVRRGLDVETIAVELTVPPEVVLSRLAVIEQHALNLQEK